MTYSVLSGTLSLYASTTAIKMRMENEKVIVFPLCLLWTNQIHNTSLTDDICLPGY